MKFDKYSPADTTKLSCLCRVRFGGVNWIPDSYRLSALRQSWSFLRNWKRRSLQEVRIIATYAARTVCAAGSIKRLSVRPSVRCLTDSSNSGRRVCCWAPCVGRRYRSMSARRACCGRAAGAMLRAASAGSVTVTADGGGWTQICSASVLPVRTLYRIISSGHLSKSSGLSLVVFITFSVVSFVP